MAVEVNSVGEGVEISWDTMVESGPIEPGPEAPPEFPSHPIVLPPEGGEPTHPIYLPPYIDNSLPEPIQPVDPDFGIDEIEGVDLTDEQKQKIKEFLTGNLPPSPPHVDPVKGGRGAKGGKQIAVQVFAQGQDGDWSNTPVIPNDGLTLLRYPSGFSGQSYVEVRGLDGSLVDSGTIQVGSQQE